MSDILRIFITPLIWLAAFSIIYALQGLSCSTNLAIVQAVGHDGWRVILILTWLLAIAVQIGILYALRYPLFTSDSALINRISRTISWTALAATIWCFFPLLILSFCY